MSKDRKFTFLDIMNNVSQAAAGEVSEYTEIYLSPYEVVPSKTNFYSQEQIEELGDTFLLVGQQQPTALGRVNGEFRILSGHRRNLANIYNYERGHEEYGRIKYVFKDMSSAMFELSLLVGNAFNRILSDYEKTEQAKRLKEALIRAQKEDNLEINGSLRTLIADILQTSETNLARMSKIDNSLSDKAKEQFKEGNLGISAAYEASKLPEDEQEEIAEAAAAGEEIRATEIAKKVKERQIEKAAEQAADEMPESKVSDSDNEKQESSRREWTNKEWAEYTLRELLLVSGRLAESDIMILQDVLLKTKESGEASA